MKIIRVSAIWCPACLIMRPRMDQLVEKYGIESVEYDYDMDEDVVTTYQVGRTLPVFILMDGDREVTRVIGEKTMQQLEDSLKGFLQ